MIRCNLRIAMLAILCGFVCNTSFAIQREVSVSGKLVTLSFINVKLGDILKSIQSQTGLSFFYSNNVLNESEPRTIKVNNVPVSQALSLLLDPQKFNWQINENAKSIRITSREIKSAVVKATLDTVERNTVRGRVTDTKGEPLPGATIKVKGTGNGIMTDALGRFSLSDIPANSVLQISFTGFDNQEILANDKENLQIRLSVNPNELKEVEVVSTGYQKLPKERATGSFAFVDNQLLNRSVSTDVLSRLDGVTSGLLFNKQMNKTGGLSSNGGDPTISIRGRSTIFGNTEPLIILDNFPYEGDPANINPNDIESVTVLKDAAAASIWGVRAGNGVIILTSKSGHHNQRPVVSFNSNITFSDKPNVYLLPQLTSSEYIDLEKFWFKNGKYDIYLQYLPYSVQSPVIDILDKEKNGLINHDQAEQQLSGLSNVDTRNDYERYFYRKALNQQYSASISGGTAANQYYLAAGFDKNLAAQVPNSYDRFTLNARNTYKLLRDKLDLSSDLLFIKSKTQANPDPYSYNAYPYEKLVDANGNALPVIRDWRQASKDALSNYSFLDWNYYPITERLNKNSKTDLTDYRINLGLNYKLIHQILSIGINYQYQQGNSDQNILRDQSSYSARLLINQFTQIDPNGGITYPVPLGGILNATTNNYKSNTGRVQLNYHQVFNKNHEITAIAGGEIKENKSFATSDVLFGYNSDNATNIPVDYFTTFTTQMDGGSSKIANQNNQFGTTDRIISYFANASYTYLQKYIISISGRRDESNLFGVEANKKGVPLYSIGASWDISRENFYKFPLLPYLRLKLTDGYNGNLSKNLSAYTTAQVQAYVNQFNAPQLVIINPPNRLLSWEKINIVNAAVDFGFKNDRVTGSIEYYIKKGENLIGNSPVAGQSGVAQFKGNTADLKTHGIDLIINSVNINRAFVWRTNFLLNYVKDKITQYKALTGAISNYVTQNYANPIVGKPYSAIFAYQWEGLDSAGNPQGKLNGKISKDYNAIVSSINLDDLKYMGTATPTVFGSLRNSFSYKSIDLSLNITYKMGYYFRRGSFISSNGGFQQADYSKRWQKPGDELRTNVPALIYPADGQRDQFYNGSEALVEKGDHIRLQDVQLGYTLTKRTNRLPFNSLRIYAYVSNLGIIWRANKLGLDPDYVGMGFYSIPLPRTYSFGITANF